MASSGTPTTHAKLNQWVLSDKPGMDDFNEDNRKLDSKLSELEQKLAGKANLACSQAHSIVGIGYEGYTCVGHYWKSDVGIGGLYGYVYKKEGVFSDREALLVLPVGYRPISYIECTANYLTSDLRTYAGSAILLPDGMMTSRLTAGTSVGACYCYFNFTYVLG